MRYQRVRTGKPTKNRRTKAPKNETAALGVGAQNGSGSNGRLGRKDQRQHTAAPALPTSPADLEAVIDKDRAFFLAQPWRTTYARWTEQPEIDALARAGQDIPAMLPGYRWATVVHQVIPGGRVRRLCAWPVGMPLDAPEAVCRDLFRFLCGEPDTVVGELLTEPRGRLH